MSESMHIPLTDIDADEKFNCRGVISAIDVIDLANDIKEKGLLQPVIVSRYPEFAKKRKKFRLIGGFRRYTAHQVNQAETIWSTIVPSMDEQQAVIMNLSENLNRQDLNIVQEARAIERLVKLGLGRKDIARRISKSDGWVQIRTMLLNLPTEIQNEISAGIIKQTDIRNLYSVKTAIPGDEGIKACINMAKDLKEAKARGVKINPRVKAKSAKRQRDRVEIGEMRNHLYDSLGPNLGARALAWAAGEIDDGELFQSIKEEAEIVNRAYSAPY